MRRAQHQPSIFLPPEPWIEIEEDGDDPSHKCRICGCTDNDCEVCVLRTGQPCSWVEDDLCSACEPTAKLLSLISEIKEKTLAMHNLDTNSKDAMANINNLAKLKKLTQQREKLIKDLAAFAEERNKKQ